jgi:hypothetical protein
MILTRGKETERRRSGVHAERVYHCTKGTNNTDHCRIQKFCSKIQVGRRLPHSPLERLQHTYTDEFQTDLLAFFVRLEVLTAVIMKNIVFWDIKTQFVLHRRHVSFPLQSPTP